MIGTAVIQSDEKIKEVVIGQSADGFVIKRYDTITKKFISGWKLLKKDTVDFENTEIELNT